MQPYRAVFGIHVALALLSSSLRELARGTLSETLITRESLVVPAGAGPHRMKLRGTPPGICIHLKM